MQYTPPHSPDPHGIPTNLGHGRFPPQSQHDPSPLSKEKEESFAKRPISPPLSSGENSDSYPYSHQQKESHPVSLLSALMHSPRSTSTSNPTSSGSGMLSPHSSVPSTAVSSPHLRPVSVSASHSTQGGLEIPAMSILRRDSFSSDGEALHAVPQVQQAQMDSRPDVVKRASSLKFAVAPPLKRRTSVNPHTPDPPVATKFDTPISRQGSEGDVSVEIEGDVIEEDIDEDEDEEMEMGDKEMNEDGSEESDLGYQEDSESSDDEDGDSPRYRTAGKNFPFARSTNFRRRRPNPDIERTQSPSPPPAPAVLPPPSRRGRGHVRVDESCISGKETEAGCSRHRSPPPSRSRSHSRNRGGHGHGHVMGEGRLSDAGPREGRAGSPMPSRSKILAASDEEDEDEDEDKGESPVDVDKKDVFGQWGGWRSDDAAFKGGMVKGIRTVSAPGQAQGQSAIADDDDDHEHDRQIAAIHDTSNPMRSFFRRASEHIPIPIPISSLRRDPSPSPYPQPGPQLQLHPRSPSTTARALSPSGSPCPPALDETPILARSVARVEQNYSGGLAHRLEQSLSSDQARAESSAGV